MSARLMQILASLARESPLRTLHTICETQHQISTRKLEQYLEPIGDELKGFAFNLRIEFDTLAAENKRLQAESENIRARWTEYGREIEAERDAALVELAALKGEQVAVAWYVPPMQTPFWGEYAELDAKEEARRIGGTAKAIPLYTHPAPQQPGQDVAGLLELLREIGDHCKGVVMPSEELLKDWGDTIDAILAAHNKQSGGEV